MDPARVQKLQALKQDLEEKVKQNPSARAFWVQLGNVCKQLDDKERAISALKVALELKSDDTFTRNLLADLEGKSLILPTKKASVSLPNMVPAPKAPMPWLPGKKVWIPVIIASVLLIGGIAYWVVTGIMTVDPYRFTPIESDLSYPKISPDGKWLVYAARPAEIRPRPDSKTEIYLAATDTHETTSLFSGGQGTYINGSSTIWLPDSSGFLCLVGDEKFKYTYHLFKTDMSSRTAIPLEITPDDGPPPALSPDGAQIAYTARFRQDYTDSLVVAYLETGRGMEIANSNRINGIAWSPDGSLIAFCGQYKMSVSPYYGNALYLMKPDGSDVKTLDLGNNGCYPIFWGKTDTKLVYASKQNLYTVSTDTMADPKLLLSVYYMDKVEGDLAVSPDFAVLAFSITVGYSDSFGQRFPVGEIYLLEEGKTEPVLAKESHKGKFSPSLGPEGKTMAFNRFGMGPTTGYQLWYGSTSLK